jgi:hypothetical protein
MATGQAIEMAAKKVIEQGKQLAADRLEAAPADIQFDQGAFVVAGTDRRLPLMQLARDAPDALSAELVADTPPSAFPNGSHVAEVEIDPDTGIVRLVRYTAIDDFGVMVNPLLVEGQVHGGVVQGIGQVLHENAVYDRDGQLLAGSFMDYAMPRADDLPSFDLDFSAVPATTPATAARHHRGGSRTSSHAATSADGTTSGSKYRRNLTSRVASRTAIGTSQASRSSNNTDPGAARRPNQRPGLASSRRPPESTPATAASSSSGPIPQRASSRAGYRNGSVPLYTRT